MDEYTHTVGEVPRPFSNLEVITRYSVNANRKTSVLSSIHDFRAQVDKQIGGQQWNTKYIRDQFTQYDLDSLYTKYDDKLTEILVHIYIPLIVIFSTAHITLVIIGTCINGIDSQSFYISLAMYVLRISVPILFLLKCFYDPLKEKWIWMPVFVTFVITIDLVITDVAVPIFSHFEGVALRPAYSTMVLLSIYIFLPIRNNFIAIILGTMASCVYIVIYAFFTYHEDPQIGVVVRIASDILYHIGVNLMGVYFKLLNEIVTKRLFLDRMACLEAIEYLNFMKEQEEKLMLSILPKYLVNNMKNEILNIMGKNTIHSVFDVKSVNEQSIQEHESVSILFADVVNYTMISTTLSPATMVELLNELFGKFDDASQKNGVFRIKFLGDCYYCVSGMQWHTNENTELVKTHAKNCIDLGIEMISIIKEVREKRALNIDMRIGVHSGRVFSGLIGMKKWQFDIWSKDVTIANKMESTGQAGKVHITRQTLEQLEDDAKNYNIEPNLANRNHPFIAENKLETYLLSKQLKIPEYVPQRKISTVLNKQVNKIALRRLDYRRSSSGNVRGNTSIMSKNLTEYQHFLKLAKIKMTEEIENMNTNRSIYNRFAILNKLTMMYKDLKIEKDFLRLPDPLFKYYITCCFIIVFLILLINGLITNGFTNFHWYTWSIFVLLLTLIIILQPLTWFKFFWEKKRSEEPRNRFLRYIYDTSQDIIKSSQIRTAIYFFICLGLAASCAVNVISCTDVEMETLSINSNCVSSWHVTQCWGLALLLNFLFIRVFFLFKWIIAGIMTTFYLWVVWKIKSSIYAVDVTWNIGLDPRVSHTLSVVAITISLYWIDRTTEHRNRLDHLWLIQLKKDKEEAKTKLNINNMLLENMLPAHVVDVYLKDRKSTDDKMYSENYDNVAVMFASVIDYNSIMDNEDSDQKIDQFLLKILDQIISDFDMLLINGFKNVEKIKVAGWTYMAACGLDPKRENSFNTSDTKKRERAYEREIVLTMVEFAATMMSQLKTFNRSSFQNLKLRIGISNGKVAAGVVGSLKPLYDIWGHAVNMASRMDSTGESDKIQVTENTACVLEECGVVTRYRGKTFVKGAGEINTYFVPLDEEYRLLEMDRCPLVVHKNTKEEYKTYNFLYNVLPSSNLGYDDIENISYNDNDFYNDFYTRKSISVKTGHSYDPANNDSDSFSSNDNDTFNGFYNRKSVIVKPGHSFDPADNDSYISSEIEETDV